MMVEIIPINKSKRKDNAAICNWVIKHEGGFRTVTTGAAIAKVVGMSYKQDIKNTRKNQKKIRHHKYTHILNN